MPEYEEVLGCFLTLERWFQSTSGDSRALGQLWADDISTPGDDSDSVAVIDLSSKPGNPLSPPAPWSGPDAMPLCDLRLTTLKATPRAVLLGFQEALWLQV